jgi:hypothetical protein
MNYTQLGALFIGLSLAAGTTAFAQSTTPDQSQSAADSVPHIPLVLPAWGTQSAAGPAAQLTLREEQGWFRIGVPAGWQLLADRTSGRVVLSNADRRGLHIWMLLVPRVIEAREAAALFSVLAAQVAPQTRWSQPAIKSAGERITVAAQGRDGDFTRAGGMSLIRADKVTIAFYTMASAPSVNFEPSRDLFAAVLESFTPFGGRGPGGAAAQNLTFERWTDPIERAFWLDVPRGWKIQGGTARKSAVDVRQVIQLTNPDQSVLIQAGDAEIPSFVEPWGMLQEGQYNGPALALRYQPGPVFGRTYLGWRVQPAMRDLAIDVARPIPQLQQFLQSALNAYAVPGIERRIDTGELLFHGTWHGKKAGGYLYSATNRISQQGGGAMWFAGDLANLLGFIAAEDQLATAVEVVKRMQQSFTVNPQWYASQHATIEAVRRITAETNKYISNIITQSYASRQATYDSIFDRYAHYQRDVVTLNDPQIPQNYQVQAGSNYYWIDDRGLIIGTNTQFNPDPLWFREMLTIKQ